MYVLVCVYVCVGVSLVQEPSKEHPYLQKVVTEPLIPFINVHKMKWFHIYQSFSEFHLSESLPGRHCTLQRRQFLFAATLGMPGRLGKL